MEQWPDLPSAMKHNNNMRLLVSKWREIEASSTLEQSVIIRCPHGEVDLDPSKRGA